jgi:hypothetical protein
LFFRKDWSAQGIGQKFKQEWQVLSKAAARKPRSMTSRAEGQAGTRRFELIEDFLKIPLLTAPQQTACCEVCKA